MAKIINLKDPITQETQYPITKVECVIDDEGKNITDAFVKPEQLGTQVTYEIVNGKLYIHTK